MQANSIGHRGQRAAAILIAALMITGTAGCQSGSSSGTGNQTASAVSDNFNQTGLPILKEKETYNIMVGQMSTVASAANKQCVKDAEKATNIHVEWTEVPTSSWDEKVNLLFASNQLPDAIIGNVDVAQYGKLLTPLGDYIDKYAPAVQKLFQERPDYPPALSDSEGSIMGLPIGDESTHNIIDSQMWVNQKWLDKLGLKIPTTTDEFENMLQEFKTKDPNGNGKVDEIPFTFTSAWGWSSSVENLFGSFGAPESDEHVFLDPSDGKTVVFSPEQDGYYKCLKWLHGLYSKGLLDSQVFTQAGDSYDTKNAGKDIIGVDMSYGTGMLGNDDITVANIPNLKGPDGKDMLVKNNVTRKPGFTIPRTCKHPEVMVRFYDYLNTDLETVLDWDRGTKDLTWRYVKDEDKLDASVQAAEIYHTSDEWKKLGFESASDARSQTSFAGWSPALYTQGVEKKYGTLSPEPDIKLNAVKNDLSKGVDGLPTGTAKADNISQRTLIRTDLDNYLKKFIANSVINGIDDNAWKAHQEKLKSLKCDQYKQLCQEYVDNVAKLKKAE